MLQLQENRKVQCYILAYVLPQGSICTKILLCFCQHKVIWNKRNPDLVRPCNDEENRQTNNITLFIK